MHACIKVAPDVVSFRTRGAKVTADSLAGTLPAAGDTQRCNKENPMRSTRASSAIVRLNARCPHQHYVMTSTGSGLFYLSLQNDGDEKQMCEPMPLDDFVRHVNGMGPQEMRRVTKNDAAFEKQLVRKPLP